MTAPVLDTKLSSDSEPFRGNVAHNRALAEPLRADVAKAALGGNPGVGTAQIGGRMIDAPHLKQARTTISRAGEPT